MLSCVLVLTSVSSGVYHTVEVGVAASLYWVTNRVMSSSEDVEAGLDSTAAVAGEVGSAAGVVVVVTALPGDVVVGSAEAPVPAGDLAEEPPAAAVLVEWAGF